MTAKPFIETFTGKKFYITDPRRCDVDIIDIAESLSKLCRFSGHTNSFYSVAEHSILLTDWYLEHGRSETDTSPVSIREAVTVLLHDASEAYVSDITSPLKSVLPGYVEIEDNIQKVIAEVFNLVDPQPSWLKELDTRIVLDEREQLKKPSGNDWGIDVAPLNVKIEGWSPQRARDEFLSMYGILTDQMIYPAASW